MNSVAPDMHEQHSHHLAGVDGRRASEQAWKQFSQAQSLEEFCSAWMVVQCQTIGGVSDGVVILLKPGTAMFAPVAFFPMNPADPSRLADVSQRALKEGRGVVLPVEDPGNDNGRGQRHQLAYPVRLDGQICGVVGMDIDGRPEALLQAAMRDLQWGSAWLEVYLRRHAAPVEATHLRMKLALDVVSTLLEQTGLKDGAAAFTTEIASRLGCDRVALGVVSGRRIKLSAVSHSAQFDTRANLLRAMESAMEEAVDQAETVSFPPERDNLPVVSHAHESLVRESGAGSAVTFPLMSNGEVVGALSLERSGGNRFDVQTLEVCEALVAVAGPIIELKRKSEISLPAHAAESTVGLWRKATGPGYPGYKLALAAAVTAALFLGMASGDFRVSANATVEGVVQRAISAPFNGYVKEAPLRAGDAVKADQVIGRFDDRDLRLERIKLYSQREQYLKQRREAMAKHDRTQLEIVGAQVDQADAQLALVEEQLTRARMVAPFDGFIVMGDLSRSLGSPVERGQVLFEVAPLNGYRIALNVDERDIGYIAPGQHGELAVASMPGEKYPFEVVTITPVNVAKEGRNYFKVEARLADGAQRLRPGMAGVGKVFVDERKLAWIWTRALTDWLRLFAWSWLP